MPLNRTGLRPAVIYYRLSQDGPQHFIFPILHHQSPRKNVAGREDRTRDRPHTRRTHIRPSYRDRHVMNFWLTTLKPIQFRQYSISHNLMYLFDKGRFLIPLLLFMWFAWFINEPHRDKTNKMACAPSKDSDQPGHPPSLSRVFVVRMKKAWVLSYPLSAQRRLCSDWADAQADLSLRWAHMPFCWFRHDTAQFCSWHPTNIDIASN